MSNSERISPTAYATGYYWYARGLSHPAFDTRQGRRTLAAFRPLMYGLERVAGLSLDATLMARHRGIDEKLDAAIQSGAVTQVIEIAAGLSPRGYRFTRRYGDRITYLDTDLPALAATKRELLAQHHLLSDHYRVVALDALAEAGPESLAAVVDQLDPNAGTAIITEGLLSYLTPETVQPFWARIAQTLNGFPKGIYLADLHFRSQTHGRAVKLFGWFLSRFVRGRIHMHFDNADQACATMRSHGFTEADITQAMSQAINQDLAAGAERVQILSAWARDITSQTVQLHSR